MVFFQLSDDAAALDLKHQPVGVTAELNHVGHAVQVAADAQLCNVVLN